MLRVIISVASSSAHTCLLLLLLCHPIHLLTEQNKNSVDRLRTHSCSSLEAKNKGMERSLYISCIFLSLVILTSQAYNNNRTTSSTSRIKSQQKELRNITDLLDTLLLGYDNHLRPDFGGEFCLFLMISICYWRTNDSLVVTRNEVEFSYQVCYSKS